MYSLDNELRKIKDRLGIVLNRYKKKKIIDKMFGGKSFQRWRERKMSESLRLKLNFIQLNNCLNIALY